MLGGVPLTEGPLTIAALSRVFPHFPPSKTFCNEMTDAIFAVLLLTFTKTIEPSPSLPLHYHSM